MDHSSDPLKVKTRWIIQTEQENGPSTDPQGKLSPSSSPPASTTTTTSTTNNHVLPASLAYNHVIENANSQNIKNHNGRHTNHHNHNSKDANSSSHEFKQDSCNLIASNNCLSKLQKPVSCPEMPQYEPIEENIYLIDREGKKQKGMRRMVCECILTKDQRAKGKRGCSDDCLNRMLMIECGSRCTLGELCLNKRFQRREYANVEPFKTHKKGWGLRTLVDLPSNAFIMEYVGEVVGSRDFKHRVKQYSKLKIKHHYFMALRNKEIIDATVKGNSTRFINHSCDPNCETQKWTVNGELRIGFFSKRALNAGEEITFDYQFQRYGKKAQKCYCGSASCRGYIGNQESSSISLKDHGSSKHRSKRDKGEHKENRKARKKHDSEEDESGEEVGSESEIENGKSNGNTLDDDVEMNESFKVFRIPRVERSEKLDEVKTEENQPDSKVTNGDSTKLVSDDKSVFGNNIFKAKPIETIGQTTFHREGYPIKRLSTYRQYPHDAAPPPAKMMTKEERRKMFEWQVYLSEYKKWWDKYGVIIQYNHMQQQQQEHQQQQEKQPDQNSQPIANGAPNPPNPPAPHQVPEHLRQLYNQLNPQQKAQHLQQHENQHSGVKHQHEGSPIYDHQHRQHRLSQDKEEHSDEDEKLLQQHLFLLEQQQQAQQRKRKPLPQNHLQPLCNADCPFMDDEQAASLCDFDLEAYYETPDRLTEDIVADPALFPCSGSYYTTPDGDNWFTSVMYNRHSHQVEAVTLYTRPPKFS